MSSPPLHPAATAYDIVASEYYDSRRHPTCANFREASRLLAIAWIRRLRVTRACCDIGCGDSLFAEMLAEQSQVAPLYLFDGSLDMLRYSGKWRSEHTVLTVAASEQLPLVAGTVSTLLCSLGDPFNTSGLWDEIARVLEVGGRGLFTTPSYTWAARYRSSGLLGAAEFALRDGTHVALPSFIYSIPEQVRMIERSGLRVIDVTTVTIGDLMGPLSPKVVLGDDVLPVVSGFSVVR